jgi:hypothetical protein
MNIEKPDGRKQAEEETTRREGAIEPEPGNERFDPQRWPCE